MTEFFSSLPQVAPTTIELCRKVYTEFDSREGSYPAVCSRPKGHRGYHGWGTPDEISRAEAAVRARSET